MCRLGRTAATAGVRNATGPTVATARAPASPTRCLPSPPAETRAVRPVTDATAAMARAAVFRVSHPPASPAARASLPSATPRMSAMGRVAVLPSWRRWGVPAARRARRPAMHRTAATCSDAALPTRRQPRRSVGPPRVTVTSPSSVTGAEGAAPTRFSPVAHRAAIQQRRSVTRPTAAMALVGVSTTRSPRERAASSPAAPARGRASATALAPAEADRCCRRAPSAARAP